MKIAIVTRLFAKWYVNVDAAHFFGVQWQSEFTVLRLKT